MAERIFHLQRDEDETGISGTGVVAEGVEFSDGTVVLRWVVGEHRSTVVWASMAAVEAIHGHQGRTRIVWDSTTTAGAERPPTRSKAHALVDCWCGMAHRREDFL